MSAIISLTLVFKKRKKSFFFCVYKVTPGFALFVQEYLFSIIIYIRIYKVEKDFFSSSIFFLLKLSLYAFLFSFFRFFSLLCVNRYIFVYYAGSVMIEHKNYCSCFKRSLYVLWCVFDPVDDIHCFVAFYYVFICAFKDVRWI